MKVINNEIIFTNIINQNIYAIYKLIKKTIFFLYLY